MPEISRFFGISISMYFQEHNPPHIHVKYNGIKAQLDLITGKFTQGALPVKQARFVLAWYEIHKDELFQVWESKEFKKIEPLK